MKLFKTGTLSLHLNPCIRDKIKGLAFKNWVQIGTFSESRSFRESVQGESPATVNRRFEWRLFIGEALKFGQCPIDTFWVF